MPGRADAGAVTVETAIVLPILIMVIFGIIEIGGALKSYSAVAAAVRAGGRTATVQGSDPLSDAVILERMATELGPDAREIEYVVIWLPEDSDDTVPAGCLPAAPYTANTASLGVTDGGTGAVGACNVYEDPDATNGAFDKATGDAPEDVSYYFGCEGAADPDAATMLDCNWPGKNRRVLTAPRGATPNPTDFVGIYVRARHDYYTSFFGNALTLTDQSISLIEPQGYDY
jgi:hypothetical protein